MVIERRKANTERASESTKWTSISHFSGLTSISPKKLTDYIAKATISEFSLD